MAIANNTEKINELITLISNLPEIGSGDSGNSGSSNSGLPSGFKLVTGTYSPQSDDVNPYEVTHNFGRLPTFAMLLICDDTGTTALKSTKLMQIQIYKQMISGSTLQYMRGSHIYFSGSGSIGVTSIKDESGIYATETTAKFMAHPLYPLKSGCTYRWVVGVMDDVQQ